MRSSNVNKTVNYHFGNDKHAEILFANALDMNATKERIIHELNYFNSLKTVTYPMMHYIISFHPDEDIDNQTMKAINKDYLEQMNIDHLPSYFCRHHDSAGLHHPHGHGLLTRICPNYGQLWYDSWVGFRSRSIAMSLEQSYGLHATGRKNQRKEQVQLIIDEATTEAGVDTDQLQFALQMEGWNSYFTNFNGNRIRLLAYDKYSPIKT